MNTTIKIKEETRKKLKLLAVLLDKSMVDVLDDLVSEALEQTRQEQKENKNNVRAKE